MEGRSFPAHAALVGIRCAVLQSLLTSNMREARDRRVTLHDVTEPALRYLLPFWYGDERPPHAEIAVEVLIAADLLGLTALKERAELTIRPHIDDESVCVLLQLATQHSAPTLLRDATRYARTHYDTVRLTAEWGDLPVSLREACTPPPQPTSPQRKAGQAGARVGRRSVSPR